MCDTSNIYIQNLVTGNNSEGGSNLIAYSIVNDPINVYNTAYEIVGRIAWDAVRYSTYTSGVIIINVTLPGANNLEVEIISPAGPPVLGSGTITGSGTSIISLTSLPVGNSYIEVLVRRTTADVIIPRINGISLEFTIL